MQLIPIDKIKMDEKKLYQISLITKSIYRLIIYSRYHTDDDLLDTYTEGIHDLKELLGIKNAQMEAQDEEEAGRYLKDLKIAVDFVISEITAHINFTSPTQMFQLLRLISPETNAVHPNRYRSSTVQVGAHLCPEPMLLPYLMEELFYRIDTISDPVIRAIYFHHEMIRIHPFSDGNGRVARIAKNWMLMYDLYPPIYINDPHEKKEYTETLASSFKALSTAPEQWNDYTSKFFRQELDRLLSNLLWLYDQINEKGNIRSSQAGSDTTSFM
ncbi:Fic family protein [Flavobacterium sp.]|uniref:Fic family protein n=2 Tax=Flavobacterium sp. TaxID=239 RepID=UPI00403376B8